MSKPRSRTPVFNAQTAFPSDLRAILRGMARWAAASSVGLAAGCSAHPSGSGLGQSVPGAHEGGGNAGANAPEPMYTAGAPAPLAPPAGGTEAPLPGGSFAPPPQTAGIEAPPPVAGDAAPPLPPVAGNAAPTPVAVFTPLGCGSNQAPRLLDGLNPVRAIDSIALYSTIASLGVDGVPIGSEVHQAFTNGTPCATALDATRCQAAIDAQLVPTTQCDATPDYCDAFLLITAGDEVTRVEERAALLALLGGIDTGSEAALVALMVGGQRIRCSGQFSQPVDGTGTRLSGDGFDVNTEWEDCGSGVFSRTVHVSAAGDVTEVEYTQIGTSNCMIGRRPEGLHASHPALMRTPLGAYFANAATLEAASVHAFDRLSRELRALGAPDTLIAFADRSARDEVRHASMVEKLARRFGGEPATPQVDSESPRSVLAIALENAVEGCVRETYGALVAHYQAETARDPGVRAAMAVIAEDETRHAALAWQVANWLEPRLPAPEQQTVREARRAAIAQLASELHPGLPDADMAQIGFPSPKLGLSMLGQLGSVLGLRA